MTRRTVFSKGVVLRWLVPRAGFPARSAAMGARSCQKRAANVLTGTHEKRVRTAPRTANANRPASFETTKPLGGGCGSDCCRADCAVKFSRVLSKPNSSATALDQTAAVPVASNWPPGSRASQQNPCLHFLYPCARRSLQVLQQWSSKWPWLCTRKWHFGSARRHFGDGVGDDAAGIAGGGP